MKKVKMSIAAIVVCAAVVVGVMSMSANSNLSAGLMFDQIEALAVAECEAKASCKNGATLRCEGMNSCSSGFVEGTDGLHYVFCDGIRAAQCSY